MGPAQGKMHELQCNVILKKKEELILICMEWISDCAKIMLSDFYPFENCYIIWVYSNYNWIQCWLDFMKVIFVCSNLRNSEDFILLKWKLRHRFNLTSGTLWKIIATNTKTWLKQNMYLISAENSALKCIAFY